MFGLGAGEIMIILVVALLVLGPTQLPNAAKEIGKAIRTLRRHTRDLQDTIEKDEHIGGTVRDLKSALRGDEYIPREPLLPSSRQPPVIPPPEAEPPVAQSAEATAAPAAEPVAEPPAAAPVAAAGAVPETAPAPSDAPDPEPRHDG